MGSPRVGCLACEVVTARERGYAVNGEEWEEWIEGLVVIAAPISTNGQVRGAACTATSSSGFGAADFEEVAQRVIGAARRIANRMADPVHEGLDRRRDPGATPSSS